MKMKKILFVALSLLLLLAFGCSHDTNNSSVTNPNPNTVYPKGYIQGYVLDTCTRAPIVGAVVDIGIAQATTNTNGQYVMRDVPATSYIKNTDVNGNLDINDGDTNVDIEASVDSGYRGRYSATINMTNASIGGVKASNYANYYYDEVHVAFASMEPSTGIINATNAKVTPVEGLGNGDQDFLLGQLTSGITGYAVDAKTLLPVPAGYTVYLFSTFQGDDGNSATGGAGNKVGQTTTDATGKFVFTKIEAGKRFGIFVVDTALDTAKFQGFKNVATDCNGSMLYFGIQDGNAVKVASTDIVCPFPLSIKANGHANYADIAKEEIVNGINVVITFNEPILPTELNTGRGLVPTFNYDVDSLYTDIGVNYEGYKSSSNIHHTLTWNAAMTQLTINIPAEALQPASMYSVIILNNRNLMDYSGNPLTLKVGTWTNDLPSLYECATEVSRSNPYEYYFTTYGARPAAKVTDLHAYLTRAPAEEVFDYDDNATIDWTAVDGAKSYNVYCRMIQWNSTTSVPCGSDEYAGQYHPFWRIANTVLTGYDLNFQGSGHDFPDGNDNWFEYVENLNIKLSYECYVRGVDADHIEGIESNHVVIEDTDAPEISSVDYIPSNPTNGVVTGLKVCFDEPMSEYTVEHATWTINAGAFSTATGYAIPVVATTNYIPRDRCLYLTFDDEATSALISGIATTNTTLCNTAVDVPVLSLSGSVITDVAKNPLSVIPEGSTTPSLPFVLHTTYICP